LNISESLSPVLVTMAVTGTRTVRKRESSMATSSSFFLADLVLVGLLGFLGHVVGKVVALLVDGEKLLLHPLVELLIGGEFFSNSSD